jgi:imidazolonepropionase-like amidohydrolase
LQQGLSSEVGQVRSGYYADLLVIDGDPLKDIRLFQDQDKIVGVMKGGRFAKRANSRPRANSRGKRPKREGAWE